MMAGTARYDGQYDASRPPAIHRHQNDMTKTKDKLKSCGITQIKFHLGSIRWQYGIFFVPLQSETQTEVELYYFK